MLASWCLQAEETILSEALAPVAPAWVASPLLQGQNSPRFVRVAWDEKRVDDFGPWRIGHTPDPAVVMPEPVDLDSLSGEDEEPTSAQDGDQAVVPDAIIDPDAGVSTEELIRLEVQAYERGLAEGRAQALAETEAERARDRELLRHIAIECKGLAEHPQRLTEPLRRLALHLAEQLVRAELQISGKAVLQLVEQLVSQLDGAEPVVVHLNPGDWDRVHELQGESQPGIQWMSDPELRPGSVRVRANDALVEDLMEHRLEALVDQLLLEPHAKTKANQRATARRRPSLNEVEDVQDVQAKPTRTRRPRTDAEDV
jgi:flagellar biosynthesis/type III secretory pathway protein FliH